MKKQPFFYVNNKADLKESMAIMRETLPFSLEKSQAFSNVVQSLFL